VDTVKMIATVAAQVTAVVAVKVLAKLNAQILVLGYVMLAAQVAQWLLL